MGRLRYIIVANGFCESMHIVLGFLQRINVFEERYPSMMETPVPMLKTPKLSNIGRGWKHIIAADKISN